MLFSLYINNFKTFLKPVLLFGSSFRCRLASSSSSAFTERSFESFAFFGLFITSTHKISNYCLELDCKSKKTPTLDQVEYWSFCRML